MARNAIESEFGTSKMADRSEMQSKVIFRHPKWPIDLKWPEMHPKCPPAATL